MAAPEDPITQEDINRAARDYASATGEEGSVTNRSIDELIKARDAQAAADAAARGGFGIRIQRLRPGGCG